MPGFDVRLAQPLDAPAPVRKTRYRGIHDGCVVVAMAPRGIARAAIDGDCPHRHAPAARNIASASARSSRVSTSMIRATSTAATAAPLSTSAARNPESLGSGGNDGRHHVACACPEPICTAGDRRDAPALSERPNHPVGGDVRPERLLVANERRGRDDGIDPGQTRDRRGLYGIPVGIGHHGIDQHTEYRPWRHGDEPGLK